MPHAGRLEVLYNGTWGTVCAGLGDWRLIVGTPNTMVVCRQLGFGFAIRSVPVLLNDDGQHQD